MHKKRDENLYNILKERNLKFKTILLEVKLMVSNKDYLKLFCNNDIESLSEDELNEIIEEELSKPEAEMNADLIEFCIDTINSKKHKASLEGKEGESNVSSLRKRVTKIIASVVAATFVIIIAYSAMQPKDNISANEEIYENLASYGFENVCLPQALFSNECDIGLIESDSNDPQEYGLDLIEEAKNATVHFNYKSKECSITVKNYSTDIETYSGFKKIEQYSFSDFIFDIYYNYDSYVVCYKNSLNFYTLNMPVSYSDVIEFVKTIK